MAIPVVPVSGFARGRFAPLADVFARVVAQQGSGGAALAVRHHGELVVDLHGGTYRDDSLQLVFSVSKSITAIAAAVAHEGGLVDLDAPLASYWPAFDKPSTATITARHVLSHRSGLASVEPFFDIDELVAGADEAALEVQEPYWVPGEGHGYHAFTYGTLLNGVFRRTVGVSVGEFVAERLAGPLGLDLWIGTPAEHLGRVVPVTYSPASVTPGRAAHLAVSRIPAGSSGRLQATTDFYNDPRVQAADFPATSGIADARSLAALYAATLDATILTRAARDAMIASQAIGDDIVLGIPMHYASGMQLPFPQFPLLGPHSYGHEAAGGSAAFADTEFDVAVGFTTSVFPTMSGASEGFLTLLPTLRHCLTTE